MSTPVFIGIDTYEIRQRKIVKLIFTLFYLLIFEGALRKWILPGLSNGLLFIRDPILIWIYLLALQQRRMVFAGLFQAGLVVSALIAVLALLQLMLVDISAIVVLYGLRNYVLYLPLPFVMAASMRADDTERLIVSLLRVSMPLGALAIVQSYLPLDSFLNAGLGNSDIFTAGDQVRTYGTFTFTAGHGQYITVMFAIAAASMMYFPVSTREFRIALFSLLAIACASVTSGSRGVIAGIGLAIAAFMIALAIAPSGRDKMRIAVGAVAIALIGAFSFTLFADRFDNILFRFQTASESEGSFFVRALTPITDLGVAISEGSILGVGLGKGTGGGSYLSNGSQEFILSENEPVRVLQECGVVLGLLYMSFRYVLFAVALRIAFFCVKVRGNYMPLLLLPFVGTSLVVGQITLNNTTNGFNWLFLGLLLCTSVLNRAFGERLRDDQYYSR